MSIVGTAFVSDIIALLRDKWNIASGGKIPEFYKQWEIKQIGLAANEYDVVIVSHDSEEADIYSLYEGQIAGGGDSYSWLHELSATLDIRTGQSEERVNEITREIMRIFKTNVTPTIKSEASERKYVHLIVEGATNLNESYRNMFRYMVSVSGTIFNP